MLDDGGVQRVLQSRLQQLPKAAQTWLDPALPRVWLHSRGGGRDWQMELRTDELQRNSGEEGQNVGVKPST